MFGVTILGNNSALPAYDRHPTAQVVSIQDQSILIDCGEATQIQMSRYKVKRSKINHIFISHLHGDHYFGLIGLITSMGLLGRTTELTIFSPPGLQEIVELQLAVAGSRIPTLCIFIPLPVQAPLLKPRSLKLAAFLPSTGYLVMVLPFQKTKRPEKSIKKK